jgi:hypothetical protein
MNLNNHSIPGRIATLALMFVSSIYAQTLGPSEREVQLQGSRLTYYPRPALTQCQADCANNPNCQGVTWINAGTYQPSDPAMCYLLSAVTGRSPARGHISAVKDASTPAGAEAGVYLNGTRLTYYQRPAFAQCQADCANNPNCQGFTWINAGTYQPSDAAMCYLLSEVTGRSPARGHFSGVKQVSAGTGGAGTTPMLVKGDWNFKCCDDTGYQTLIIATQTGATFTGSFEGSSGRITGQIQGTSIVFDNVYPDGSGSQHYVGQLINGQMVNGTWSGYAQENVLNNHRRLNWHAEKRQ